MSDETNPNNELPEIPDEVPESDRASVDASLPPEDMVDIIVEDELESVTDELEADSETVTADVDSSPALVDIIQEDSLTEIIEEDALPDEDEEVVVRDFLNEDDGESLDDRDYLKPPEPEWKAVARQLREEREAKKRAIIEDRREQDRKVIEDRKAYLREREATREQKEAEFREIWQQRQQEKKEAVNDMMQRIREDRERKTQERAETDEREFGKQFNYPKPEERARYPKPSELRRIEREQPQSEDRSSDKSAPPTPKLAEDIDLRISRLSKPDTPEIDIPADDDTPNEPTTDTPVPSDES